MFYVSPAPWGEHLWIAQVLARAVFYAAVSWPSLPVQPLYGFDRPRPCLHRRARRRDYPP